MITATKSKSLKAPIASTAHYTLTAYFEEQSTSSANNTSKILARATLAVDNTSSFAGSNNGTLAIYWFDNNQNTNGKLIYSRTIDELLAGSNIYIYGSKDIPHKADGTLSGYAKAIWTKTSSNTAVPVSGNVSTDNTSLTNIARASGITISKGSYDIADNYVLITLDRKSNSYTDTVAWTCSNLTETIQTKSVDTKIMLCFDNNSYNNITAPSGYVKKRSAYSNVDIMNKIPNSTSINMTFATTTYNGNTSIGSNTATFNYQVYKTVYSNNLSYEITDTLSRNLTGATDIAIKGISNVKVTNIPSKILNDNSTITSYSFVVSGMTGYEGSNNNYTFQGLKNSLLKGFITDSRGYTTLSQAGITLDSSHYLEYVAPTITNITATRTEATSSTINVSISGSFWNNSFGSTNNSITLTQSLKIDNGNYSTPTTITPTISGNSFTYTGTVNVPSSSTGTLKIVVKDSTNTEYELTASITKGESLFDIGEDILKINNNTAIDGSFAVGNSNSSEVLLLNGQEIKPYIPVARIVGLNSNTNYTMSSTYGHTLVRLDVNLMNLNATNKIAYSTTNGYFIIGSGVNHIRVSANIMMRGIVGALIGEIQKTSGNSTSTISADYMSPASTGAWVSIGLTPKTIAVSQGDIIKLTASVGTTGTLTVAGGAGQFTYLNVEVVD